MLGRISSLLRVKPPVQNDAGYLLASGSTVPTDGESGYQTGCIFQHTDGGDGTAMYVNEGTVSSCDFNAIEAGSDISQLVMDATATTAISVTGTYDEILSTKDAVAGKVIETGTYQSTADGGVTLTSSNNRPVSFLFDDSGAAMTGDIRGVLSRVLVTVDQASPTLNAIRGQIKMLNLVDTSTANAVVSPITSYFELAGTGARSLAGHVAAFRAAIEEGASGTTTVAASSYYAGFEATLNSSRTYTETGDMAAFMANISGGSTKWPRAFWADAAGCTTGIYVGKHGNTAGSGISLGGATAANRFHSDDGGSALTGDRRGLLSRLAVIAEHTGALSLSSICGQTKLVNDIDFDGDYVCGLYGYLEMGGANDLTLNGSQHAACAVRARTEVGGNLTVATANSYLAGVFAELNTTGSFTVTQSDGILAAFVAAATDQKSDLWGSALYIDGADNAIGFAAADSSYTNGIKAVTQAPTGNTSHVIRVDIGGTPGYIPVYSAEALGN